MPQEGGGDAYGTWTVGVTTARTPPPPPPPPPACCREMECQLLQCERLSLAICERHRPQRVRIAMHRSMAAGGGLRKHFVECSLGGCSEVGAGCGGPARRAAGRDVSPAVIPGAPCAGAAGPAGHQAGGGGGGAGGGAGAAHGAHRPPSASSPPPRGPPSVLRALPWCTSCMMRRRPATPCGGAVAPVQPGSAHSTACVPAR